MQRENIGRIVQLSDEQKKEIKEEITAFYLDVRGDEIGIIEQQQIMDLFLENLAPIVYNKALDDAKRWFLRQMDNVDSDYYALYKE